MNFNFNWLKKRLTFVIIPDANNQVVRLRLSGWMLTLSLAVIVALAAISVILSVIQARNAGTTQFLQRELASKTALYEQTLAEKNETIESQLNDLIRLSQQAEEVKEKIEELKQLENEVKWLTSGMNGDKPVVTLSAPGEEEAASLGGVPHPIQDEDAREWIASTEQSFQELNEEADELFGGMTDTKKAVQELQYKLAHTPTIWPTDSRTISSGFGIRVDPFNRRPSFHNGIDISGRQGSPVYAAADGTVVEAGWNDGEGYNIIIDHGNDLRTQYMHLQKLMVDSGDKVTKGGQIATMGSTGRSTGPHLHYTVLQKGKAVDPSPYLKASRKDER